jgi:hypothetical protein
MNLTNILIESILEPAILWLRQHEHLQIPYNFQPFSVNKNQVKLSLYLIKHHAMKMYGERKYSFTILDLGTRWR